MTKLLNPDTFTVPTLPSHERMPEGKRPVFVFRTRTWRETIELDQLVLRLRNAKGNGKIAEEIHPAIMRFLVVEKSSDTEGLTYTELAELFAALRICEDIEMDAKKNLQSRSASGVGKPAKRAARKNAKARRKSSKLTAPTATEADAPPATKEGTSS